jgi:GDPmannose 4,6-dehydratase
MSQNFKVIIFGFSGQDGYYLGQFLKNKKIEFIGVSRNIRNVKGDVGDFEFVKEIIERYKPTHIFHFAANSTTKHQALFENHKSISTGTLNILEAVRLFSPNTKVFISGSAMQFENKGLPIDEKTPFAPSSAYSVSRIDSVFSSRYYREEFGLKIYIGYFFNHDSPLRSEMHINQKIVKAVNRISIGSKEKLKLGNIEIKKEFSYAVDIVNAAWILINQDEIFEAVIGSGKAYSIKDWLEYCFTKIGEDWKCYVEQDQNFKTEYNKLISNPALIKSLGWKPKVDFKGLADIMLKA